MSFIYLTFVTISFLVHLLGKARIKVLFDGGIVTLTKNKVFVGKGYDDEGLFVLNVDQVINEKSSSSCAYLVDSIDVGMVDLDMLIFAI